MLVPGSAPGAVVPGLNGSDMHVMALRRFSPAVVDLDLLNPVAFGDDRRAVEPRVVNPGINEAEVKRDQPACDIARPDQRRNLDQAIFGAFIPGSPLL